MELKTPITYYGGKQTMLKHILPLIPDHSVYTEAFCGGASVLFAKEPVPCEVINDINAEIINFYWMAKCYYPELKTEIDKTLHSRYQHDHATYIYNNPALFKPAERACAFWFLTKTSFASKINGTFGFDLKGGMPKRLRNAKDTFTEELCSRLEHVTIECQDAISVIKRYDRPETFHFIDPPYINTNCAHYNGIFNEQMFIELLDMISSLKGKFMLTMFPNDHLQDYATLYRWTVHRIERTISASRTSRRKQEEWIVCNY